MDYYDFSTQETADVKNKFPQLELVKSGTWEGSVDFNHIHQEVQILGTFSVRIVASKKYPVKIPLVYDIGGRARAVALQYGIKDPRDIHLNPDNNTICLCVPQEEAKKFLPGSNLADFINSLVIPYFYGLEYYNEQGKWPWRDYSHSGLGLLEYHAEDTLEQTTDSLRKLASHFYKDPHLRKYRKLLSEPNGRTPCPCRSGKAFQECHTGAWRGFLRLHDDIRHLGMSSHRLFLRLDRKGKAKPIG